MPLNEHGTVSVKELLRDPIAALDAYYPDPAWKMPLHKDIIHRRLNDFSFPGQAVDDETFLRDVHKVVKAWYGKREWLIVDFDIFKTQVRNAALILGFISRFRIENLEDECTECYIRTLLESDSDVTNLSNLPLPNRCCKKCMTEFLWDIIISPLNLTKKNAKIVSGTKTLHHFIPNLLPPMDNSYTGEFFLGYGIGEGGKSVFRNLYSGFVDLARCLKENEKFMARVGVGFNTSLTKTLDNAIIGFVIREDMAMAHAIEEGMKTPVVSKQELLDILQPKHVYRS